MKRKRVILHIGSPKTGSTYLQSFFSRNVAPFRAAGVDYPYAEAENVIRSGATVGNVVSMLHRVGLLRQKAGSIRPASLAELWTAACADTIISVVRQSPCDTVLLSSEGISLLPQELMIDLYERLSVDCDTECIMFVRDPFDCFYSSWRQMVKTGRFLGGLEEFVSLYMQTGRNIGMFNACRFLFNPGMRKTLVNYDDCRKDVAGAFLKAVAIDIAVETEQPVGPKLLHNRSLSPSESLLLTCVNNAFAGTFFPTFVRHKLLDRTDYIPSFSHYYNREIDAEILKNCSQCIEDINRVVQGDPLRTCLRDAPTSDDFIEVQDISVLIAAMQFVMARRARRVSLLGKIKHALLTRVLRRVPRDFDPDAYRFMNKDVAAAGIDPYIHYERSGCREARPYRYY